MRTPYDASPEDSRGRCSTQAVGFEPAARRNRRTLVPPMRDARFINYPTESWHWSFGDRYWAHMTGLEAALRNDRAPMLEQARPKQSSREWFFSTN